MLGVAACSPAAASAPSLYDSPGGRLFLRHCAACHGARGEGGAGPLLNAAGHAHHHTDGELATAVTDGIARPGAPVAMPAWGNTLSPQEVRQVLEFVKGLWTEEQRQFQQALSAQR